MEAFPSRDHARDLKDLDLSADIVPMQHSVRLKWNLQTDRFVSLMRCFWKELYIQPAFG